MRSADYDLSQLEAFQPSKASWCLEDCVALVVGHGEAWRGCRCSLLLQGGQVICSTEGRLLARIAVHRVTKVGRRVRHIDREIRIYDDVCI